MIVAHKAPFRDCSQLVIVKSSNSIDSVFDLVFGTPWFSKGYFLQGSHLYA